MSESKLTRREVALLYRLDRDSPLQIAGIIECQTALSLAERGLIEIEGEITPEGGSGMIKLGGV